MHTDHHTQIDIELLKAVLGSDTLTKVGAHSFLQLQADTVAFWGYFRKNAGWGRKARNKSLMNVNIRRRDNTTVLVSIGYIHRATPRFLVERVPVSLAGLAAFIEANI